MFQFFSITINIIIHIINYFLVLKPIGKVLCWASNKIGVQKEPCGFFIHKAGPPSPLLGCSVTNKTTTSLTIQCLPGDNGGSKQMFHAHIFQSLNQFNSDNNHGHHNGLLDDDINIDNGHQQQRLKTAGNQIIDNNNIDNTNNNNNNNNRLSMKSEMNLSSDSQPIFFLNNLTPGTSYMIELYASNNRGQSDISHLDVATLVTKNTKLSKLFLLGNTLKNITSILICFLFYIVSSSLQEYEYDSWFSVLIGFLMTILLVVVAIYIGCRVRHRQISRKNRRKEEQIKQK